MNIGALTVGGIPNNSKEFKNIFDASVDNMRHTYLPDHKFVKGQPDTGSELAEDLEVIAKKFEVKI